MAEENRVQLKQEEIVGNEVVLTDFNPITNTESVDDTSKGIKLSETLDRMWQSINGKLSRIVNSVNGRTGVVVLNSDDVGLGNVDNVSFADIKQWVIDLLIEEFGNKKICLVETLDEIDQLIASNDQKYRDRPFYSKYGYGNDKKAYIGYIAYNETLNHLEHEHMPIFTIGKPNNSIIYDEKIDDSPDKDLTGGGIGVNIYKYEDALYLYNAVSGNKNESGLRINKSKIVSNFYFFDGVYGNGSFKDPNGLISIDDTDLPPVHIYLNGNLLPGEYHMNWSHNKWVTSDDEQPPKFKVGDIILCNFNTYYTDHIDQTSDVFYPDTEYQNTKPIIPDGMSTELMGRRPAIGMITMVPSEEDDMTDYSIKFSSITPNLGWGLENMKNHNNTDINNGQIVNDSEITLKLAKGFIEKRSFEINGNNMSGLQVSAHTQCDPSTNTPSTYATNSETDESLKYAVLPDGADIVYGNKENFHNDGGLHITTDMSLCIQPQNVYGEFNTPIVDPDDPNISKSSNAIVNWATPSPSDFVNKGKIDNGVNSDQSLIGINIAKIIKNDGDYRYFLNCSGLRVEKSTDPNLSSTINDARRVNYKFLGYTESEMEKETWYTDDIYDYSGGLSVNVGEFLEIGHGIAIPPEPDPEHINDNAANAIYKAKIAIAQVARAIRIIEAFYYTYITGHLPGNDDAYNLLVNQTGIYDSSGNMTENGYTRIKAYIDEILGDNTSVGITGAIYVLTPFVDWDNETVKKHYSNITIFKQQVRYVNMTSSPSEYGSAWENFIQRLVRITGQHEKIFCVGCDLQVISLYATDPIYTEPEWNKSASEFNEDGKINVRIGKGLIGVDNRITININDISGDGLMNDGTDRITVKIKTNGGLAFTDDGSLYVKNDMAILKNLRFIPETPNNGISVLYDPKDNPATPLQITVGPGLIMTN